LCQLGVVDYSLLLIIDEKNQQIRMGIIDYLRKYDFEKKAEHVVKKTIKGHTPTITSPEDYKNRFQKAFKRNFMKIEVDK